MRWLAPPESDATTATLEKRLWDAADQFRANSGLKAQEYSGPILGLIFLRFAEVRFAARRAALEEAAHAYVIRLARSGQLPFLPEHADRWWRHDEEIDVVAISDTDRAQGTGIANGKRLAGHLRALRQERLHARSNGRGADRGHLAGGAGGVGARVGVDAMR